MSVGIWLKLFGVASLFCSPSLLMGQVCARGRGRHRRPGGPDAADRGATEQRAPAAEKPKDEEAAPAAKEQQAEKPHVEEPAPAAEATQAEEPAAAADATQVEEPDDEALDLETRLVGDHAVVRWYVVWQVNGASREIRGIHRGTIRAWRFLEQAFPARRYMKGYRLRRFNTEQEAIHAYYAEAAKHNAPMPPNYYIHR